MSRKRFTQEQITFALRQSKSGLLVEDVSCPASQGGMEGESQASASTISPGRAFHEEKDTSGEGILPEPGKPPLGSVSQSSLDHGLYE